MRVAGTKKARSLCGDWVAIRGVWSGNFVSQSLTGSPIAEDPPALR